MKIEVLLSCMHQHDHSIVERTNIQSDVVVVNQCNEDKVEEWTFTNLRGEICHVKFISTTERGLSCSRNMAIRNANADVCLICDDDETLEDNYVQIIQDAFETHSKWSVISFKFVMPEQYHRIKTFYDHEKEIGYRTALKISSVQIAFKRQAVLQRNIVFDETIGSGVTKAGGEEVVFLHSCLKCGLKIGYIPINIVSLASMGSQWTQFIFTDAYFEDWGYYVKKMIWGKMGGSLLSVIFAIKKRKEYKNRTTTLKALKSMLKGIWNNRS